MPDRLLETEATYPRIAEAVKNAAFGETTILSSSAKLPVARALAFAEQQRLLTGLEEAVRLSVGHGRIHIEPRDKALRRAPRVAAEDRRRLSDRRRGERRLRGPDDPIELLVVGLVGERRSGGDRRSGADRRQATAPNGTTRRRPRPALR